ncbi:MAG: YecA family protein [Cellulosilyticaceae bacterium]
MKEQTYSLVELLATRELKELQILAQLYKFRGYSQYEKEEFVNELSKVIERESLQYLATFTDKDLELFEHLAEAPVLAEGRIGRAALFVSLGWANLVQQQNGTYLVIAKEIFSLHEKAKEDEGYQELREHRQDFRVYRNGIINLYGTVELHWVVYLYNRDHERQVNFEILLNDLNYMNQLYGGCILKGDYLVHESLCFEGEEEFQSLKKLVYEKKYFEPSRVLIRLMSQENYYEDLAVLGELKNYIRENFIKNEDFIEEAILSLILTVRATQKSGLDLIEDIMQQWYRLGINVQNMAQLQEVTLMLTKAIKNTRSWHNKGYTEEELTKAMFPDLYNKEQLKVNGNKVGRNDPCPCGSGQKYKKCCL